MDGDPYKETLIAFRFMDLNHTDICLDRGGLSTPSNSEPSPLPASLETEIPEILYIGMKDFIGTHPNWDQYRVLSSALANFLFQNGCSDRAVTERYLNDLFTKTSL